MRWTTLGITLRQLQYAVAVAETKHFGRAAQRCHVSQPSLSAQVGELELSLGATLFERNRRGVFITADGVQLIECARRALGAAEDLVDHARHMGSPMTGMVRLGVIPTIAPYLLPALDPELRTKYEGLNIRWIEDRTDALVARLALGELDGALLAAEADLGSLTVEAVATDEFVLAAAPGNALVQEKQEARVDELRGQRILLLSEGHCFRDQALEVCGLSGAHEDSEFRATSLVTLVQMVAGGLGVTLLPRLAVSAETRGRALGVRHFVEPRPHRTLALAWRPGCAAEPMMQTLSEAIREFLADGLAYEV